MEKLKNMKKALIKCVESQINDNLGEVDAKELGEAVDMIKDLEEAIYYATITKAMEGGDKEEWEHKKQPHHIPRLLKQSHLHNLPSHATGHLFSK